MLTAKKEKFVFNLVKGMSQREAYKRSYNAKKMKDKTIDNKACKLFKEEEVRARYNELVKELEEKAVMSAQERMEWLTKVVKGDIKESYSYYEDGEQYDGEREANVSTKIKALDTLNKMTGQYVERVMNIEPPKIEDDV